LVLERRFKVLRITFKVKENGKWTKKACGVSTLQQCIDYYDLENHEYEIIKTEEF